VTVYLSVVYPADTGVNTPLLVIVATEVVVLLHVPPVPEVLYVAVPEVLQILAVPLIVPADKGASTVTDLIAEPCIPQLFVMVYIIVSIPAATPVTIPVLLTVAMAVLVLLQVPPVVALESVTVVP